MYGFSYVHPQQYYTGYASGFKFASYNTWNVGASYNWNMLTFDVRYYGTSLGQQGCATDTSDPASNATAAVAGVGRSNWCGNRVMGSISMDFTSATFK